MAGWLPCSLVQFRTYKVIYRRYAGLFFSLCVDLNDNELVYLESIHLFVEILDHFFSNVCELDLVFNFHKVRGGPMMTRAQVASLSRLSPAVRDCLCSSFVH